MREKTFPFTFDGREYHLRKLGLEAKEDLLDRIVAGRFRQAQRMFKKGFLTAAEFIDAKQSAYGVKWGTEPFLLELADPANARAFVRALLVEEVDDATCDRLVAEQRDTASDMAAAIQLMREDDDPKATTPPSSVPTPKAGAACS